MHIEVRTAIIGGIDQQKEIPPQTVEFERIFYTDPPGGIGGNDRMKALFYKCNPFSPDSEICIWIDGKIQPHPFSPDSEICIWIDGKIQPQSADFIEQIITALGNEDIAVLKHHERSCIYQEVDHIEHCMRKGNEYLLTRYANKPIRKQVEAYRYFGYPANNGLNDCAIIAMRNSHVMREVCRRWWDDVYRFDGFDQTAIQFYCWIHHVRIQPIIFTPGSYTDIPHIAMK